ncbi:hypothetical protein ACFQPF_06755 [Fictibacillus iocasae]|uniref:WGR domain-containing protein n=1 Tax=Fictibacillus iocasae TaxID=2715437 RepID=A0ABW2NQ01_9BACL
MMKLLKKTNNAWLYWEVWNDGKLLTVHYGTVGDRGEAEEIKLGMFDKPAKEMERLASEQMENGYEELDEDELIEFVVQFSYTPDKADEALEKRHIAEDIMNEALGWTGNGHCDGGDVGSGTTNIFCYVVDPEKALQATLEELRENELLDSTVKIAYENSEEEYVTLYPPGVEFELM